MLAGRNVLKDPGIIVGPIAFILGAIINVIFNLVYNVLGIHTNSLGISIIILTVFVRLLMTPIAYHQQKSMFKMQALQPEMKKIQEKYKGAMSDPELQRKMNMEMQKLYADNNYNQLAGCLPMLIQLPIFLGLYHVMQNPFKYIDIINTVYSQISDIVLNAAQTNDTVMNLVVEFGKLGNIPAGTQIDANVFSRIMNILGPDQMKSLGTAISSADFTSLYDKKNAIEYFMGLNLTETVGLSLSPRLIIPILSGGTTWLSSWLMSRKNKPTDPAMVTQQRIMSITMPLMMAWITTSLPGGIGVYWITSNLCMIIQQFFINKRLSKHPIVTVKAKGSKAKGGK